MGLGHARTAGPGEFEAVVGVDVGLHEGVAERGVGQDGGEKRE